MTKTDVKTIAFSDADFKSSVLDSARHLGCRVLHSTTDDVQIEPSNEKLSLITQTETWHFTTALKVSNTVYQAVCQGNQVSVKGLQNERISHFQADNLVEINQNDLAVALACFIERGYEHLDAMTLALAWLTQQARGAGAEWPTDRSWFPTTSFEDDHQLPVDRAFAPIRKELFTLYPVVDSIEWLTLVLEQGVTTAQLRVKDANDQNLKTKIQHAIALGQEYGAQVFINDYWQLAIELGAYGVHLGQEDIEVADLSAIQKAGLLRYQHARLLRNHASLQSQTKLYRSRPYFPDCDKRHAISAPRPYPSREICKAD